MTASETDLNIYRNFFFIGIGGAGMSAIALVLKGMGFNVSGSDIKESRYVNILRDSGIRVFIGHHEKNIEESEVIIYSAAILSDNIEMKAAFKNKVPVLSRSDALAWILNKGLGIAVAGTHGKTTTTSMISLILNKMGMDPTIIIGGELNELGTNASFGSGSFVVAEACESDGSFLKYRPFISIVTNIEEDHMEYYGNYDNLIKSFIKFMNNTKGNGFLIVNGDEIAVNDFIGLNCSNIFTFGLSDKNDLYAQNIILNDFQSSYVAVFKNSGSRFKVKLNVPGIHNIKNSLASIAAAFITDVDIRKCVKILESFTGVKRRFEKRGIRSGAAIIDDYAHHPTEIKATLDAATKFNKRIVTVFQPHRYSRTKALYKKFQTCFNDSDILILTDIYSAGEQPIPGVTSKLLTDYILENGFLNKIAYIPKLADITDYLDKVIKENDLVLIMGAGDITRVSDELIKS
ncbi:MAG: UDP-N-acetylmuramate--L-alanine ligase [Candidatus Humimicrobiaceae bacterium]